MKNYNHPVMEFHVTRTARDRYQFDQALFSLHGNVIFANFHAARTFAQKMNAQRDLVRFPEQAVRASEINAMGLIDELLHLVIQQYREQRQPQVLQDAIDWLEGMLGAQAINTVLHQFTAEFPPLAVYRGEQSIEEYLASETGGISHRQVALEELVMLWLANANPAFSPYRELFDDTRLENETVYQRIFPLLRAFFDTQPPFGPNNQNLIDMLRAPALASPYSLTGQLEYIRQYWSSVVGRYLYRLLTSLDLIKEEEKAIFLGPGPARVIEFVGQELEPERFSPDLDWMPRLVLIAKNAYVWLDQLSKKYQRQINRLDLIPSEELDTLAGWGITGLWLIGLWERSAASQRIKQLRGNPEAVASAYSLFDYSIARDLGGDEAYENLRQRAWQRGIRLASDMVPNHMGIDSRWVIEHPDWFISLDYSPFPAYTFNGPNLSWDERVGIYLEDHYYNNSDAAVVFKRVDFWSGQEKYIYHGNDGTSFPWNDTAQLNYLNPQVREAVIQTILHVARKFPIIRFDAAMTLAKKHFQRLWFPVPGSGGDIPSRAEFGLSKEGFDAAMPEEFWREVVDRVALEVPDTLLLAEAFWMMEGYFVRTLGMHRVYNSAFMNMLRDEKNTEYRLVIKNTLEFDPEILKRYVNFMNNPDERTAVDQFGKGDKYFGICVMMATLPGLPMLGHGQVEGYTEKYGMEYRRAYWDEQTDSSLVDRHTREVFPLLRKRYLFSQVQEFLLYDFFTVDGAVNEDVYAYSNRAGSNPGDERGLVIYHNRYASTRGWIRTSAAYSNKSDSGERSLIQRTLADGLSLDNARDMYTIFRDQITGLEYIRNNHELHENGLYLELNAYQYYVFLDFRQVQDSSLREYATLAEYLNRRGVPSIDEAVKELFLQPILGPFREIFNAGYFRWLITNRQLPALQETPSQAENIYAEAENKLLNLLVAIHLFTNGKGEPALLAIQVREELASVISLPIIGKNLPVQRAPKFRSALLYLNALPKTTDSHESPWDSGDVRAWGTLLGWLFSHSLGAAADPEEKLALSRSWIDEWLFGKFLAGTLRDLGLEERAAWQAVNRVRLLIPYSGWWKTAGESSQTTAATLLKNLLSDRETSQYLGVNRYQDVLWFNQEGFEDLLWWLFAVAVVEISAQAQPDKKPVLTTAAHAVIELLLEAEVVSGYQVEKLLAAIEAPRPAKTPRSPKKQSRA
jgi:glycosidase